MKWLIQENSHNEVNYPILIDGLIKLNIDYEIVKVIPLLNIIVNVDTNKQVYCDDDGLKFKDCVMVLGSLSLLRIAKLNNWQPAFYSTEGLKYTDLYDFWGKCNILNHDTKVSTISDLVLSGYDVFIRPLLDNKAIGGQVMTPSELRAFKFYYDTVEEDDFSDLNKNTLLITSSVKKIYQEHRLFIVGGKIVGCSQYKLNGKLVLLEGITSKVYDFIEHLLSIYNPLPAFVVDVATLYNGNVKVIEINCINTSGFYNTNMSKVLQEINILQNK